jgi:uncharacterized protein YfiM (DUF2279 family)
MKRLLAISALLASSAHADSWTGQDKTLHFVGGAAIGASVTIATGNERMGMLAGAGVGLVKEIYDSRHRDRHTPSGKDFAVTVLGAVVGSYTGLVVRKEFIGYNFSF